MKSSSSWIRSSIRAKLTVFLLLAIALPMFLSIYVTNARTSKIVTSDALDQASNLIFQGKTNLMQYLTTTNQASLLPYNENKSGDTLYRIMEQGRTDYLSEQEVFRAVLTISQSVQEIQQVYLYNEKAERAYLVVKGTYSKSNQSTPYPSTAMPDDRTVLIEPTHLSHDYGVKKLNYYPPKEVITIHRRINQIPSGIHIGDIAIDLSTDVIDSICNQLYKPGSEQLYLLSEDGTVVYGPDEDRGKQLKAPWVNGLLHKHNESGSVSLKSNAFDGVYVYEKLTAPYMNWTLVKMIPRTVLTAGTRQVTEVNTVILSIFLVATIAAAVYISFRITYPIKKLIRYVNKVQAGDLEVDIQLQRSDEIGILADRFSRMMETINNLILKEYRLELANKSHQLKALQAQVQPHFLYNALQSIGTLALQNGASGVYALISQLAKMMRYSMSTSEQKVSISQEIEHAKAYLDLQKQRFGDKLTVEFDINKEVEACIVPRMIVQPVIENCFKHGFDSAGGQMRIRISGCLEGSTAVLTVEDDGAGMPKERLLEVTELLKETSGSSFLPEGHIGLANVLARLRLDIGPAADIELKTVGIGGLRGLRVVLRIPCGE